MSSLTFWLLAAIFSLGLGNALFFLVRNRGRSGAGAQSQTGGVVAAHPYLAPQGPVEGGSMAMPPSIAPMAQKIELAHVRLQALESRVKSMQGIYEETLKGKIEKLEAFRHTATAEIIAVKEILEEMRTSEGPKAGRPKPSQADKSISAGQIRRLIYRSSSG